LFSDENINILPFSSKREAIDFIVNHNGLYISMSLQTLVNSHILSLLVRPNVYGFIDGIGAQFFFKRKFGISTKKIPGCELWLDLLSNNKHRRYSIAIIGATKQVNDIVVEKLAVDFPRHCVNYFVDGFTYRTDDIIKKLNYCNIDIVFIALGQPKQEKLGLDIIENNPNVTVLGIGGALDVYSGVINRAPQVCIDLNLEWLYRLLLQPKRITNLVSSFFRYLALFAR
jgi:UDP-N-acetyl-D-mannosaminouronate:lipid I N-acetyl-D-mannosaminouronosyltransferase